MKVLADFLGWWLFAKFKALKPQQSLYNNVIANDKTVFNLCEYYLFNEKVVQEKKY